MLLAPELRLAPTGGSLEIRGNGDPRWMVALDRTRRIGQLVPHVSAA